MACAKDAAKLRVEEILGESSAAGLGREEKERAVRWLLQNQYMERSLLIRIPFLGSILSRWLSWLQQDRASPQKQQNAVIAECSYLRTSLLIRNMN